MTGFAIKEIRTNSKRGEVKLATQTERATDRESYLLNCWYMAGWSADFTEAPTRRILLGAPMLLARSPDGAAFALHDRCPHRFVPLSAGKFVGNNIECPYHGLRFDAAGTCTFNPQGTIPAAAKVRSFPVIERHGVVWFWPGDPEQADPGAIPDFTCNDIDTSHLAHAYLRLEGNYQLATDNILDLSHVEFIHRDTLAQVFQKAREEVVDTREDGNDIWSGRYFKDVKPGPGGIARGLPAELLFDRWLDVRWSAPAAMLLTAGIVMPGATRETTAATSMHTHIFTPETQRSCHYWFAVSQPRVEGQEEAGQAFVEQNLTELYQPFADEDGPILAAQQQALGNADFFQSKPVYLPGDGAATRVRRRLESLIKAERRQDS